MTFFRALNRILYSFSLVGFLDVLTLGTILFFTIKFFTSKKSLKAWKSINIFFLIFFLIYLLFFAILSRSPGEEYTVNLIPLSSYYRYFLGNNPEAFRTNTANLAVFYPPGLILSDIFQRNKKKKIIIGLIAFGLSASIEIVQCIFSIGYTEIDDIIHNTLGAVLGVIGYDLAYKRFLPYIQNRFKNKKLLQK